MHVIHLYINYRVGVCCGSELGARPLQELVLGWLNPTGIQAVECDNLAKPFVEEPGVAA
jgi:hypothetical protein